MKRICVRAAGRRGETTIEQIRREKGGIDLLKIQLKEKIPKFAIILAKKDSVRPSMPAQPKVSFSPFGVDSHF
jgi:hypothetical protein